MSEIRKSELQVLSPLQGWSASLDDNPDPVFSGRVLGDGVSIDPTEGLVSAPFDGTVLTVPESKHAINLLADNGAEFLIHVGVDTVGMGGSGFTAHVEPGERVQAGQKLLTFDMEQVLRGAASLKTPVLLLSDGFLLEQQSGDSPVSHGTPLFLVRPDLDSGETLASDTSDAGSISIDIRTGLLHGIHARPAATLKAVLATLEVEVSCQLGEHPPADMRSPVALMSLGVLRGDTISLRAWGPDAQVALDALTPLLEPISEQEVLQIASAQAADKPAETKVERPENNALIRAQAASPGLCMGVVHRPETWEVPASVYAGTVAEETERLQQALTRVSRHLQSVLEQKSGTAADIALAHLALLDDPSLTGPAENFIDENRTAEAAWYEAVRSSVNQLLKLNDERMNERVDDLMDINLRVQRTLAGFDPAAAEEIPDGSVLVSDNLLPSQLLELDHARLAGICTAEGGTTSHVAILAMSLGIPMLVAAGPLVLTLVDGDVVQLDGDLAELCVNPDESSQAAFKQRMQVEQALREQEQAAAHDECRTRDGDRVHILANLASADDARAAVAAGAEGCGLLRTEFIFMDRPDSPSVEQQLQTYQQISDLLGDRPLVVRTLDAGGDKPIPYLQQAEEENPALGVRGIRLSLDQPQLLDTQLEALLRLQRSTAVNIMIPMVTSLTEVTAVRERIEAICAKHGLENKVRLGIMIETPAAALLVNRLASHVDFFSIGTNDLTQYTLCMDRGEPRLAEDLDTLHPSVLALIKTASDAAQKADIPVAVCGGAAGDRLIAPVLLGLGIRELSMPGALVARQKAQLRELSISDCRDLAESLLHMTTADEVRRAVREFHGI